MNPRIRAGKLLALLLLASAPTLAAAQDTVAGACPATCFADPDLTHCSSSAEALPLTRLPFDDPPAERAFRMIWGIAEIDGYLGQRMAPNGVIFHPDYGVNLDFNIWLCPTLGVYIFDESLFWMGTTHALNFTKREYDMNVGLAWNYYGRLEARIYGYSDNNLNRGSSLESPGGYNDGFGMENRFYLNPIYDVLGTSDFDQAKATFVSIGYLPTKTLTGADGQQFHPALFARAYLTWELAKECSYLYADVTFMTEEKPFNGKLLDSDVGAALRPFQRVPRLEFRLGCQDVYDMQVGNARAVGYLSMRYIF
jgi:hypothetical protein